jgi:hypothetical protein
LQAFRKWSGRHDRACAGSRKYANSIADQRGLGGWPRTEQDKETSKAAARSPP